MLAGIWVKRLILITLAPRSANLPLNSNVYEKKYLPYEGDFETFNEMFNLLTKSRNDLNDRLQPSEVGFPGSLVYKRQGTGMSSTGQPSFIGVGNWCATGVLLVERLVRVSRRITDFGVYPF